MKVREVRIAAVSGSGLSLDLDVQVSSATGAVGRTGEIRKERRLAVNARGVRRVSAQRHIRHIIARDGIIMPFDPRASREVRGRE